MPVDDELKKKQLLEERSRGRCRGGVPAVKVVRTFRVVNVDGTLGPPLVPADVVPGPLRVLSLGSDL